MGLWGGPSVPSPPGLVEMEVGHLAQVPGGAEAANQQTRQSLNQSNWVNKAAKWGDDFGNPCAQPCPTGTVLQGSRPPSGLVWGWARRHALGWGGPAVWAAASPSIKGAATLAVVPGAGRAQPGLVASRRSNACAVILPWAPTQAPALRKCQHLPNECISRMMECSPRRGTWDP